MRDASSTQATRLLRADGVRAHRELGMLRALQARALGHHSY
ncbi:MAG: hypothetical protein AVDCRST_MAG53-1453 [uncultured Solirubrobacteraceae bacterium]|uniref:Uncharacterized protein n=1 Tax=uncultured Solirubrobacteraceae bacterium TaxID=1162706 RepID=A0A6J4S6K8_9ACTN|nr:MAG: hypothetical protein AVDCRST_MAG53-1453 [uncultured Solirubrobacteraceae bacterium]